MKKTFFLGKLVLLQSLLFFLNCKENKTNKENHTKEEIKTLVKTTPKNNVTFHKDTTKEYEYRTGTPGDYTYNYNVHGIDADGKETKGNITVDRKYGKGILTQSNGKKTPIHVEWSGYGQLLATDQEGKEFELFVNKE